MKVGFVIPGLCNSEVFLIPEATYEFLPGANPIELQGKKQITIARDKRLVSILYPTITDRSGMGLAAAKASSNKLPLKSSHVECLAYILIRKMAKLIRRLKKRLAVLAGLRRNF